MTTQSYERFEMLNAAWQAAKALLNHRGELCSDLHEAEGRFLKQKCCKGLIADDCRTVFQTAVAIAETSTRSRRSKCGSLAPKPTRRYELLHDLAKSLEDKFPGADSFLIMAGCRSVEMHWDR